MKSVPSQPESGRDIAGVGGEAVVTLERLRRSEEIFSLLVASVKDYAIFMLDPNGYVMTWNSGAERTKGYLPSEIIGKHFSVFYTDAAKQLRHPEKELEIAISEGRYEEEGWRVKKDGTVFWANVVITAVYDQSGELIGFAKVTRDLTERRLAEEARAKVAAIIEESNQELQHLAYVVSHELQAPSATIGRYCNLLSVRYKSKLGEDANDFMAKMSDSSKLIARMVDDLWNYARVSRPTQGLETVDFNQMLNVALEELKDVVDKNEVTRSTLPSIQGNRQQLTFVLKELVYNGVRFRSSDPPRIEITAQPDDNGWLFKVKDNGIGIDKVIAGDIFKVFHRVNAGPVWDATGMGLAVCRKIIERHDGRIWFESTPGLGTTILFWLPNRP